MTRKTCFTIAAALVFGGGLFFILTGAVLCQIGLHVPMTLSPTPPNASTVDLLTGDHAKLSAWWLKPSEPNGNCVAVLHGIGDSRAGSAGFAPMFLSRGYPVLLPDSRAHGASGGHYVTYGLLEKHDAIAWALWMKNAGCRKVYGLGESLGASILILAAEVQPEFAAIVAECPFAELREVAEYRVREMSGRPPVVANLVVFSALTYANWVNGLDLSEVSPVRSIARASTPILLIHGLNDVNTPPYNSQRLAKANPRDSLWLVPNAPHVGASRAEPEEFRRRVLEWFEKH